jgi:hypothetical protein
VTGERENPAVAGLRGADDGTHDFTKILAVLREDCEHLAAHPGTVGDPLPEPRYELAWTDRR